MKKEQAGRGNSAQIRRRSEVTMRSGLSVTSSDIENYFPKERKFRASMIGEIRLDRSIHRLYSPVLDGKAQVKGKFPAPMEPKVNPHVAEFLEVAKMPFRKKPNYQYCFLRSIQELSQIDFPLHKLSDLPKVIPNTPYAHEDSHRFLRACKFGNTAEALRFISKDQSLVYSFDELHMTGLHWAALRNYVSVAKILLINHSIVDAIDVNHRTPLLLACKKNNIECVKVLLSNKANPRIASNSKKLPLKVTKNSKIQEMIKKFLLIHNNLDALPRKNREEYWETYAMPYLINMK